MEPKSSLLSLQESITGSYPEPDAILRNQNILCSHHVPIFHFLK